MKTTKNNVCCRIFKEQFDLIRQLPEKERAEVLFCAVSNSFNQFDFQFDNQNDFQNDCAYVSVSVSDSVSELGKCIINLLSKNIVCKEFSNNYGGKRTGSGRKSKKGRPNKDPEPTPKKPLKKTSRSVVTDDWFPKQETQSKLQEKWFGLDVNKIVEYFKGQCQAKGIEYADFDRAILNWDYSSLKKQQQEEVGYKPYW